MRITRSFWNSIRRRKTVDNTCKGCISRIDDYSDTSREVALPKSVAESRANRPLEESVFVRQGDYWIIRYQGQATILKATRGLDYVGYLLRYPAQDVHVSELLAPPIGLPAPMPLSSLRETDCYGQTLGLQSAGPILDSRAKAEYKRRIDELRKDRQEAERLNDFYRAARARGEMETIAEQLAVAVGLVGRERRFSSNTERARSAVTKRIRETIKRIAKIIPPLGQHLAARIKTGYFCSYNPHPDRLVAWKF